MGACPSCWKFSISTSRYSPAPPPPPGTHAMKDEKKAAEVAARWDCGSKRMGAGGREGGKGCHIAWRGISECHAHTGHHQRWRQKKLNYLFKKQNKLRWCGVLCMTWLSMICFGSLHFILYPCLCLMWLPVGLKWFELWERKGGEEELPFLSSYICDGRAVLIFLSDRPWNWLSMLLLPRD